jgi:hypothetical protein
MNQQLEKDPTEHLIAEPLSLTFRSCEAGIPSGCETVPLISGGAVLAPSYPFQIPISPY